jgi:hypothetical protein
MVNVFEAFFPDLFACKTDQGESVLHLLAKEDNTRVRQDCNGQYLTLTMLAIAKSPASMMFL